MLNLSGVSRIGGDAAACARWTQPGIHIELWEHARNEARLGPLRLQDVRLEGNWRDHAPQQTMRRFYVTHQAAYAMWPGQVARSSTAAAWAFS